jgi:AraC family transcriptional regulator, regulatory protein of adaptative response / methylated-DNA-[protein]-cysteine methyltransferase
MSKVRVAPRKRVSKIRAMKTLPANFVDSRDFARIARAIAFINENFRSQPRLEAIAASAGLSEFHFNRLFRRWAGITPKQYLTFVTGSAARDELGADASVLDAALNVGLSGPGRLHDLVLTLDAMTPGELKAQGQGTRIRYGFSNTPFGRALFAATDRGLSRLNFVEYGAEREAADELRASFPRAELERDDDYARELAVVIWPSRGATAASPLRLAVAGTNFQLKVWQALVELGAREHTTYGDIARSIGSPDAMRAVGSAVGANPIAWLIPCHHVLRKGGALGGYRWGEARKRVMLAWDSLAHRTPVAGAAPAARPRRAASL